MVTPQAIATLNDIGTEELAHLEIIGAIVHQLVKDACIEEIEKSGLAPYYADHDKGVYPVDANGVPFTAAYIQVKGNPVVDLNEDLAAEQKAYEIILEISIKKVRVSGTLVCRTLTFLIV